MNNTFTTIGASNHSDTVRSLNDYYATDPVAILYLKKYNLLTDAKYWECACGKGNLSRQLEKIGYEVKSTDLFDYNYGVAGVDFLECDEVFNGNIITNPPFKLVNEFIKKGLELASDRLYIFARIQILEGLKRYEEIFRINPPVYVCPFVKRIKCEINGEFPKESAICYAWFIWDNKDNNGETKVKWLI